MWRQVCLAASSCYLGPWTVQREGDACSGGLSLEHGLLRWEPTPQKEYVCCRCSGLCETGGNGGGGGGKRSQSLSCCGLATLRLPADAALQLMEERVPLEIQGIQVYHHLSLECLCSASPCGGI